MYVETDGVSEFSALFECWEDCPAEVIDRCLMPYVCPRAFVDRNACYTYHADDEEILKKPGLIYDELFEIEGIKFYYAYGLGRSESIWSPIAYRTKEGEYMRTVTVGTEHSKIGYRLCIRREVLAGGKIAYLIEDFEEENCICYHLDDTHIQPPLKYRPHLEGSQAIGVLSPAIKP